MYMSLKRFFAQQIDSPSDDFVRYFLQSCYSGAKTQNVIERFRPLLRKALNDYISETMNDKLKAVIGGSSTVTTPVEKNQSDDISDKGTEPAPKTSKIITTEEELEAYFIIKNMLQDIVDIHDITYKDTQSYINILYKNNTWKWICRLYLSDNNKLLIIPDENKKEIKHKLTDIYELKNYSDAFHEVVKRYL